MVIFLGQTKPRRFSKPSKFRISFRQEHLKSFFIRAPFPAFATHPACSVVQTCAESGAWGNGEKKGINVLIHSGDVLTMNDNLNRY